MLTRTSLHSARQAATSSRVGDIHIHVDGEVDAFELEDDSSILLSDEGSLTLSAQLVGGRRRSSSSIRFADDTDTGKRVH